MDAKSKNDQFNKPGGPFPGGRPPFGPNGPGGPGGPFPGGRPPFPMPVEGVDFLSTKAVSQFIDLAYATVSPAQKLDLYLPQGRGPFPVVVLVHGGGFMFGDKADPPSKSGTDQLLERGFAVANVNYRLSAEAKAPAQIWDVKTAVRWLRAHAQEFHLNPARFGAWGGSAGGSLVAMLGTSYGVAAVDGAELGCPNESSQIQAVVDWFGPIDFLKMDEQFAAFPDAQTHNAANSPESVLIGAPVQTRPDLAKLVNAITYISPSAAPFLIQHGTADRNVPPQQSQMLYDALKAAIGESNVTLTLLEGAGHGGGPKFWDNANVAMVLAFLEKHLK
jgi:acetyl esterase/lipase